MNPESISSGIEGQVIIRPISPVERRGVTNFRPYSATMTVLDESGRPLTQFRSGEDGYFRVTLAPGTYTLRPESPDRYPRAAEQAVTVSEGEFTHVCITYDSGIR
jgi:hypothetical protein